MFIADNSTDTAFILVASCVEISPPHQDNILILLQVSVSKWVSFGTAVEKYLFLIFSEKKPLETFLRTVKSFHNDYFQCQNYFTSLNLLRYFRGKLHVCRNFRHFLTKTSVRETPHLCGFSATRYSFALNISLISRSETQLTFGKYEFFA